MELENLTRDNEGTPSAKEDSVPKRPNRKAPRLSTVIKENRKKQFVNLENAQYIQLVNRDGNTFFLNIESGDASWILPKRVKITQITYMTHIADTGQLYYENIESAETEWEPPKALSSEAKTMMSMLCKMNTSQCETVIRKPYDHDKSIIMLEALENMLIDLEEGFSKDHVEKAFEHR